MGVLNTFAYLGIAYLIVTVLAGLFMRNPPDRWEPAVGRQQPLKFRIVEAVTSRSARLSRPGSGGRSG